MYKYYQFNRKQNFCEKWVYGFLEIIIGIFVFIPGCKECKH